MAQLGSVRLGSEQRGEEDVWNAYQTQLTPAMPFHPFQFVPELCVLVLLCVCVRVCVWVCVCVCVCARTY